jgi:hypothetical protein
MHDYAEERWRQGMRHMFREEHAWLCRKERETRNETYVPQRTCIVMQKREEVRD